MKTLYSKYTLVLLLTFGFYIESITAIACDKYNITKVHQKDDIIINFSSNHLLKLNRTVRCTSNSSLETIYGCTHRCGELGYGQDDEILIKMQHDNGTTDTCTIKYHINLQEPTLVFLEVPGDRVRLGIARPMGSFDYVNVECSDEKSYIIFNTSTPLNSSVVTVECSFISNLPLMNFILETVKKDFNSAVKDINQEVPLPVPFTNFLDSRLLTVITNATPVMNLFSTYEFQLIFYDKNNESITYERAKILDFNPNLSIPLNYSLIPNLKHQMIFTHIVNSTMYARSNATILPISNSSYPFEVTNLRVVEEFHNIIVSWNDSHSATDPIEFLVFCNSNVNSTKNANRNTIYVCEKMTFNETNTISVETRVAIPGYIHDRKAIVTINVQQVPEIPLLEVLNKTERSITIQWNYNNSALILNSFEYKIQCGLNAIPIRIDVRENRYRCQSLEEGTVYVITMLLVNTNDTVQRRKSIQTNTLLETCQYINHFYPPVFNGTRSVIVEWSPPDKNFDKIYVTCPSSYSTFEYYQVMSTMYFKCIVINGIPFNVTFSTLKSGFEWATFQFTDTPPADLTTTTTKTTTSTTFLSTITTSISFSSLAVTTTTTWPNTSTTRTTTSTFQTTVPSSVIASDCSQDILLKTQISLTRWRTSAIIAFIIAGFLTLSTICLIVLCILLCLRNRSRVPRE